MLRQKTSFSALVVFTLALGIGSTAAVFGMADQSCYGRSPACTMMVVWPICDSKYPPVSRNPSPHTTGAEKRKQHGSKGALVFRDPNEADRVWVVFDWDEKGWQSFVSDPAVPPIMKEAGHKSKPQAAKLGGQFSA
jgi:hypothetical protein